MLLNQQAEEIEVLKEEIKHFKGHKGKPPIKVSQMNQEPKTSGVGKRPGSEKRKKTGGLKIHEEKKISVPHVSEGSVRRGHQIYVVQDLIIKARNTLYRLERWQLPDGSFCAAKLPREIEGHHFGAVLRSFIDCQHHKQHVTQVALLDQLRDFGIEISVGQLSRLLTENKGPFHQEKEEILSTELSVSSYITVDDTGARNQGRNGYCIHIGNELFTWFESTGSKSCVNFLQLLRAEHQDYDVLDENAFAYMTKQKLPQEPLTFLKRLPTFLPEIFCSSESW